MNAEQLEIMRQGKGFVAALDQSGGSTPKALRLYGIQESEYKNDDEMFQLIHEMRTRIIKSNSFTSEKILAAILFKVTMNSKIDGMYTADYLWEKKRILPILKVDQGLQPLDKGVQLMKPLTELEELLKVAKERHIFGTKMRSVIKEFNEEGIREIVKQQFEIGKQICDEGFVPILEPEVDINAKDKEKIEEVLKDEVVKQLDKLDNDTLVMFKFTIPNKPGLYDDLMKNEKVVRIVALSGGYTREDANKKLAENKEMIASFSRALTEGLKVDQSDSEFEKLLGESIDSIYKASVEK